MLNKLKENKMYKQLTTQRKKELDAYTEEEILFLWNAFSQAEINYIESKSA